MPKFAYPEIVACPTCGKAAVIQASPVKYGVVESSKPSFLYWCDGGHSFHVHGSSLVAAG